MSPETEAAVRDALSRVMDPCSVAAGAPLSLLDMGLVRGWSQDAAGRVEVTLDVTSPMCFMAGHMIEDAERQLRAIPEVADAVVSVKASGLWSHDSMTEAGRRKLQRHRDAQAARTH